MATLSVLSVISIRSKIFSVQENTAKQCVDRFFLTK